MLEQLLITAKRLFKSSMCFSSMGWLILSPIFLFRKLFIGRGRGGKMEEAGGGERIRIRIATSPPSNLPLCLPLLLPGLVDIKLFSTAEALNGKLNLDRLWGEENMGLRKKIWLQPWPTLCSYIVVTCQRAQCVSPSPSFPDSTWPLETFLIG